MTIDQIRKRDGIAVDFISQRVVDGVVVTALRNRQHPSTAYLAWGDRLVPVDLRACWSEEGVREVMRGS
jgi:hypothetical protein